MVPWSTRRMLCLLVLSSPLICYGNTLQSLPHSVNEGKLVSKAHSRLTFLTPESQDGTILVSLNDDQPPFRVVVLDLILNLNVQAAPESFVVGSSVDIDMSALDNIPKISPANGWTRGSSIEPLLRFVHASNDVRKSKNYLSEMSLHRKEGNNKFQSHGTLRSQYYSQGGMYRAAQLLDISYAGKSNLKVGDALIWNISVLQGAAPLASISINFVGPYDTYFTVAQNFSTPVGFEDNSTLILNETMTSIITKPWMDGSYSISSISLRTQACPLRMSTEIYPGNAYAYVMASSGTATVGSQRTLSTFNLTPLIFGSGRPPNVTCPSLLSFEMESAPVVSIGGEVRWNFTVQLGTYPLAFVRLFVRGPLLQGGALTNPQSFQLIMVTATVGAGGRAGEGSIVAGTISVPVTSAWIPGEYNSASQHPSLNLAVDYPSSVHTASFDPDSDSLSRSLPGCTVPPAPFFSTNKLLFVVNASRPTPPLSSAQLLSFRYTGPAEVRAGDSLTWEYSILQVRIRLCLSALYIVFVLS
jgi:hypothetical protein